MAPVPILSCQFGIIAREPTHCSNHYVMVISHLEFNLSDKHFLSMRYPMLWGQLLLLCRAQCKGRFILNRPRRKVCTTTKISVSYIQVEAQLDCRPGFEIRVG